MIRRLLLIVGGLAFIALVGTVVYVSVSYAYGAFGHYYYVTADLDRAGQQLKINADVRVRGVQVGKVSGIELVDRHARLTLQIDDNYQIPQAADAVVSLKTPLGAKYVDMQFDPSAGGPYLADGDSVAHARVGPELEDLLADGVHVLHAINPNDAANLISTLATATRGHGIDVARGFRANSALSDVFAQTLDPQIQSLKDFNTIFGQLKKAGVDLNRLSAAINEGVPVYASPKAQKLLDRALTSIVPFAHDLADLLILNRRDWNRMFNTQDIVLGTLSSHTSGLRDLVHGLYRYVYKLGQPIDKFFKSGDGSAGAGFTAFSGGNGNKESQNQICDAFPAPIRKLVPVCVTRAKL
jgi:phospholipid/cholesterol/gamma-HCH transport system substrate-binding protein